ncbi:MAG TPA: hypothetical protein VLH86_04785 [Patescibacteria group bacterium]|nr:hypothetical protein [Patescibacteria group bacterium]
MMLFAMLAWWYTAGWAETAKRAGQRLQRMLETFSVSLLLGSLFEPFKQISAGQSNGKGLDTQLRDFGDRLFSRVFGAVVRSLFILMGLFGALITMIIGLVQIILWPLIPALPVVGAILAATGWVF